jgi:hypothetical protein
MRWRRTIAMLVAGALCAAGCGSPARDIARKKGPPPCPEGTDFVQATDVIGQPPPNGYVVDPGDPKALEDFAMQFRTPLGKSWRGYDAKVLLKGNKVNGAAIVVINSGERTKDSPALVKGIEAGARERGQAVEQLTIAGQDGRMVKAIDGSYIAMAPTDLCAALIVVADRESLVRDAAAVLPASE